jgi:hypothetical protein
MIGMPLIFGEKERAELRQLRELAARQPVDMPTIMEEVKTPGGKQKHMDQMTAQTVEIPFGYLVTFSIEQGHGAGACRHMSMSSPLNGRVPRPEAVWMVAEALGFNGGLSACATWDEDLQRGDGKRNVAINVVQPISVLPSDISTS